MGRWYFSGAEEREWLKVAGGSKARLLEASWASWKGLFLSNNSYTNGMVWFMMKQWEYRGNIMGI